MPQHLMIEIQMEGEKVDFLDKIESIRTAFKNGLYEPALALALTIPDICGTIEYPGEKVTKRYIEWCDNNIFTDPPSDPEVSFTGAALYQLRCHFLHNGDNGIFKDQGEKWAQVPINEFCLMEPKEGATSELMLSISTFEDKDTGEKSYKAIMNMRYLINLICDSAEEYYDSRQKKEDFDDHVVHIMKYSSGRGGD